ncbi:MAG: XcyI family restriction endonuclease [Chloroflexi bacterium]|nr:XcyI family restriction endonuclease [Chloroflexota bacterium]
MTADRRTEDAIERSAFIAGRVASAAETDAALIARIEELQGLTDFADRGSLAIEETAWQQVLEAGIEPSLVFAHPEVLKAAPQASLHYRGLALLSLKRVSEIATGVERWEDPTAAPQLSDERVLKVCRLYNVVISSLIFNTTDWAMDDAYRNVIATIGISADGSVRNLIGQLGENAVKNKMFRWVTEHGLLAGEEEPPDESEPGGSWILKDGIRMIFASEPDISFERDGVRVTLIEIKAGKDPAGALERLGAVKKTFDEAPPRCDNYLVVGVVTPTMRLRLDEMRMQRDFDIDQLLHDEASWDDFVDEIFNHSLRILQGA